MKRKFLKVLFGVGILSLTLSGYSSCNVDAATLVESVYTNNCPGIEDWRHDFYKTDIVKTYTAKNITGWVKKDSYNDITLGYTESVTGTIGYSVTNSNTAEVGTKLMDAAVNASKTVSSTLSFDYSNTTMATYTWTINKDEPGTYFSIGVNYKTRQYNIKHYHQKFKWFGQGEYEYKASSSIECPTEKYLAKNYRYEIDGITYER